MVNEVNDEQKENAYSPISVTLLGMMSESNEEQLENAFILVKLLGIVSYGYD